MNKNIIIVLAGGFLVAILVAILVQATLGGKEEVAIERVQILVAAKDLSVGRELRSGDIKWQTWPEDTMFAGAIIRDGEQQPTEAIKGKLLRSMVEGQPIHMSVVAEEDKGNFLSANVQKGMRAVGISVSAYKIGERLFRPGDFVDVMVTYRVRINTRTNPEAQSVVSRYATETVIENVRVLAVDSIDTKAVDEEEDDGKNKKRQKSSKKATVTLEVTPEAAEVISLAGAMGDVGLALRSIGDNSQTETDKTTTDVGLSRVMTKLSKMTEGGGTSQVRIYSGAVMQEVKARNASEESSDISFAVEDNVEDQEADKIELRQEIREIIDEENE